MSQRVGVVMTVRDSTPDKTRLFLQIVVDTGGGYSTQLNTGGWEKYTISGFGSMKSYTGINLYPNDVYINRFYFSVTSSHPDIRFH